MKINKEYSYVQFKDLDYGDVFTISNKGDVLMKICDLTIAEDMIVNAINLVDGSSRYIVSTWEVKGLDYELNVRF